MKVGDVVVPINGCQLACGSGSYSHAVIVSMKPLVLVSEGADMLWKETIKEHEFESMRSAPPEVLTRCLDRLYRDYPNHKLHQFMDSGEIK